MRGYDFFSLQHLIYFWHYPLMSTGQPLMSHKNTVSDCPTCVIIIDQPHHAQTQNPETLISIGRSQMNEASPLKDPVKYIAVAIIISVLLAAESNGGEREHLNNAFRLVEKTELSKMFIDLIEASLQSYFDRYEEANPENEAVIDPFRRIFYEEVNASEEELKWNLAEIYAKYFSETELGEIIHFFDSPAGKKWLDKKSMVLYDAEQIGQEWGQILTKRIIDKFKSTYGEEF